MYVQNEAGFYQTILSILMLLLIPKYNCNFILIQYIAAS